MKRESIEDIMRGEQVRHTNPQERVMKTPIVYSCTDLGYLRMALHPMPLEAPWLSHRPSLPFRVVFIYPRPQGSRRPQGSWRYSCHGADTDATACALCFVSGESGCECEGRWSAGRCITNDDNNDEAAIAWLLKGEEQ